MSQPDRQHHYGQALESHMAFLNGLHGCPAYVVDARQRLLIGR
jgi:hypothetical protein